MEREKREQRVKQKMEKDNLIKVNREKDLSEREQKEKERVLQNGKTYNQPNN